MRYRLHILFCFVLLANAVVAQKSGKRIFRNKTPETVKDLAVSLTQGETNDSIKVLKIYQWITSNISYDYSAYMSGEPIRYQSPELVYRRRKTTCTGYSNLMVEMLEAVGVKAYTVEGFTHDHVLGLGTQLLSSDHAWVAFSVNGNWHVADPTWDAGDIGLIKQTSTLTSKKNFWQRLKTFRWKDLFKRKKKSAKTTTRTRVSYKMGFRRQPSMNYIYVDPNEFLKTHLPNVAHIQMRSAPVSVAQFADSAHALGELVYSTKGSFNYNALNEAFYALEIPERYLWTSDSSLNYHALNHGDKALNAYNYLGQYYGVRTSSAPQLEKFVSISDTVILHGNLAIKINRDEYKKKRVEFQGSFQTERKWNSSQQIQVNQIRTYLVRTQDVLARGKERMKQKELPLLLKMQDRLYPVEAGVHTDSLAQWTKDPKIGPLLERFEVLKDSVIKYQRIERMKGVTYLNSLGEAFYGARMALYSDALLQYEGTFLNERDLLEQDRKANDSLLLVNAILRDSLNTLLTNRSSYAYLLKLDNELFTQLKYLKDEMQKDSSFHAWGYRDYIIGSQYALITDEMELIDIRLQRAEQVTMAFRTFFLNEGKELALDMKDLSYLRSQRQAYLWKMMNNKYNRSIKVYTIIVNNTKNLKKGYLAKLKMLVQNV